MAGAGEGERRTRLPEEQEQESRDWYAASCVTVQPNEEGSEPYTAVTIDDFIKFIGLKKFHRRSYHYPKYGEVLREAEKLGCGPTRLLQEDQFLYLLDHWVLEPDVQHELKLAFKVFDTEMRHFLELEELALIVTTYGEQFNEAELREFLRDANIRGNGNVDYEEFVDSMFRLAPELEKIKVNYLYTNPDEDPSVSPEPIIEVPEPEAPPPPPPPPPKGKDKGKKKK